jgi:hypothetical protein
VHTMTRSAVGTFPAESVTVQCWLEASTPITFVAGRHSSRPSCSISQSTAEAYAAAQYLFELRGDGAWRVADPVPGPSKSRLRRRPGCCILVYRISAVDIERCYEGAAIVLTIGRPGAWLFCDVVVAPQPHCVEEVRRGLECRDLGSVKRPAL